MDGCQFIISRSPNNFKTVKIKKGTDLFFRASIGCTIIVTYTGPRVSKILPPGPINNLIWVYTIQNKNLTVPPFLYVLLKEHSGWNYRFPTKYIDRRIMHLPEVSQRISGLLMFHAGTSNKFHRGHKVQYLLCAVTFIP